MTRQYKKKIDEISKQNAPVHTYQQYGMCAREPVLQAHLKTRLLYHEPMTAKPICLKIETPSADFGQLKHQATQKKNFFSSSLICWRGTMNEVFFWYNRKLRESRYWTFWSRMKRFTFQL